MKPAVINLQIFQGATFRKEFRYNIGNPSVPVDITNASFIMQIRKKIADEIVLIELSTTNGRIHIIDGINGVFELILTDEETTLLDFTVGVYDLKITINGETDRFMGGTVSLSLQVTRPV